jgi:hypothetical protein
MANMSTKQKVIKKRLSEKEIDDIVIKQSDNDSAWESPIYVSNKQPASLSIPPDLATRASFLARLHRETGVEKWLMRIIRERIELEEVAFIEAKRDIAAKESA